MKKRLVICVSIFLFCSLIAPVFATAEPALPKQISLVTYPLGTSSAVIAIGWAELLTRYTPMAVIAKHMAGPTVYIPKINAGQMDLGTEVSPTLHRAWTGKLEYDGRKQTNLRALWRNRAFQVPPGAVRKDSNILSFKDLKGKRLASDFGGVVNVANNLTVALKSGNMTWADVVKVPVAGLHAGWVALREGRVDATYGQGITVPDALETHSAIGIRFLGYDSNPNDVPGSAELAPGCKGIRLKPRGILDRQIWAYTVPFWYVSSTHLSDDAAYELVKAAWEHGSETHSIHPSMRSFKAELMLDTPVAPFHAGAIRWYKERGVWTEALEQKQKELLGF